MRIQIKLFAVARERLGADNIEVVLQNDASVGILRSTLASQFPALAEFLPHVRFAVNSEYASDDQSIPPGAEVAVIPPVSGG
jgi:molybdopterin converting factor subunit 1